ncbi:MAG: phosphate ABC transporter substrate-binding protein, partial [Deltaproteobacteria bacterium]|nr:phosphate ABC transporter substrate-binding protein [Deltaproteobacteria bacterium]
MRLKNGIIMSMVGLPAFTLVILLILTSSLSLAAGLIQIKGSDTEVNAVQRMAEVYMQRYKGAAIAVTGGGSGVGIAAIINRTT